MLDSKENLTHLLIEQIGKGQAKQNGLSAEPDAEIMQHDLWQQARLQTAEVITGPASDTVVRPESLPVALTGATIDQYAGCQQAELKFHTDSGSNPLDRARTAIIISADKDGERSGWFGHPLAYPVVRPCFLALNLLSG